MDSKENVDTELIRKVTNNTQCFNIDNISRTQAYQTYFQRFPEIKWAFLASMVSRNAGWNMSDLETPIFKSFLTERIRKQLFSTYERANWLIFSDAYPQLLLYQISKQLNKPMFDKLACFAVSSFMIKEWYHFWHYKDEQRLMTALIINEQNVIESPVTTHPFYRKHVFLRWPYLLQDFFCLNAIVFPSRQGYMFAYSVHDFANITKRITFGKKLASILFNNKLHSLFYDFAIHTEHTGSRNDYENYLKVNYQKKMQSTPILRTVYPIIDHQDKIRRDWFKSGGCKKKWWDNCVVDIDDNSWNVFYRKRKIIKLLFSIQKILER
ncbi:DUF2515 family protein [Aquibacillus saliphilus]|uniref:DUF2515 family protein n=1 Tax=Aquibacillus saliphilus TaxID=1909422 RepID=UPI001CF048F2|nr:DUF2515 family protein [Aquibacillus saliphilus]